MGKTGRYKLGNSTINDKAVFGMSTSERSSVSED
jgi:hypothetical protein